MCIVSSYRCIYINYLPDTNNTEAVQRVMVFSK